MFLHYISSKEIEKYINKLPSIDSSGYDNISNTLLKKIKYAVLEPLTHIFNPTITSREFPESMKLSEIIPLYKKGQRISWKIID